MSITEDSGLRKGNADGSMIIPVGMCPSVNEQRLMIEKQAGEPCFRIWITPAEYAAGSFADWICYELSNGHMALWRKSSELRRLRKAGEMKLYDQILERKLDDSII